VFCHETFICAFKMEPVSGYGTTALVPIALFLLPRQQCHLHGVLHGLVSYGKKCQSLDQEAISIL
ncbi:hypothetical protein AVEN_160658-1, partial [Araneus ventricosus]